MKIAKQVGGGDFYESFSDLIFGTLIIFLVVVLALMVQVQKATEQLDNMMGGIVSPHRFAGGTGGPKFHYCVFPEYATGESEPIILLFPWELGDMWNEPREPGVTDPVLDLSRAYIEDGLLMLTASEFVGMAGGLTPRLTGAAEDADGSKIEHFPYGRIVIRLFIFEQREGQRMRSMAPEEIRERIGGLDLFHPTIRWWEDPAVQQRWFRDPSFPFANDHDRYESWLQRNRDREYQPSYIHFMNRLRQEGQPYLQEPSPGIRVRLTSDKQIIVGETRLTKEQFMQLLASISPGRGFVIEYVDDEGEPGAAPPVWFEDEVLFPAGYDARVLKPEEDD